MNRKLSGELQSGGISEHTAQSLVCSFWSDCGPNAERSARSARLHIHRVTLGHVQPAATDRGLLAGQ